MDERKPSDLDKLAKEHWEYTEKIGRMLYIEAFKHGYKHGKDRR